MVPVQQFGTTGTRYELDVLHQCGIRVKTKSQKVPLVSSYVCRSYRGKTGRGWGGQASTSKYQVKVYFLGKFAENHDFNDIKDLISSTLYKKYIPGSWINQYLIFSIGFKSKTNE